MDNKKNRPDRFGVSPLRNMARDMDTFFNQSFKQINSMFNLRSFRVYVDETEDYIIVTAELPGYKKDQIMIEVLGNRLRIAVENLDAIETKDDLRKTYTNQHSYEILERQVTLPFEIPEEETKATFQNGLLKLTIPKQNSKRRYIDIDS